MTISETLNGLIYEDVEQEKDLLNEKVSFRDDIKWFRKESIGSHLFKETYDYYTPFKMVILYKEGNRSPSLPQDFAISEIFKKFNWLTKEKIQNLKEQLCFVPVQHNISGSTNKC